MEKPSEDWGSQPGVAVPQNRTELTLTHYNYMDHISSETLTMEFKTFSRLVYFDKRVRENACGFLNCKGGRLFIGVDDDGRVRGNKITFKACHKLREKIDSILGSFDPPVLPATGYCVDFVPVLPGDQDSSPAGVNFKNLWVLCLTVKLPVVPRLYWTDNKVKKAWMRRGAEVVVMDARAVQQWYLQHPDPGEFYYKQNIGSEDEKLEFKEGLGAAPDSPKDSTGAAPDSPKDSTGAAPDSPKDSTGAAPDSPKDSTGAAPDSPKDRKGRQEKKRKEYVKELRRYASAFMNNKGGQLMFGVANNGNVLGINIDDTLQDKLLVHTDEILKNFKPPVWPENYSMEFLPVLRGKEEIPASETLEFKDLKVLRLTFTPPPVLRQLYRTDEEKTGNKTGNMGYVFMKRKASVEDMTPSAVHGWYEKMWTEEVEQKSSQLEQLRKENDQLKSRRRSTQRKMAEPASEEATRKSQRLESKRGGGKKCGVEVPELKKDDEELKKSNEVQRLTNENLQLTNEVQQLTNENERLSRQQGSSQDRRDPPSLVSQNVNLTEGERGKKQNQESDGREVQEKMQKMNLSVD